MLRILVATSGSAHSQLAVRQCAEIGHMVEAAATLLTVISHKRDEPQAVALEGEAVSLLRPAVAETETKIRFGQLASEIAREVDQGDYNLVIMEVEPSSSLLTRLLGPAAERVIGQVPCPVLIARDEARPIRSILLCDSGLQAPPLVDRFFEGLEGLITVELEITVLHVMSQISAGPGIDGKQLRATAADMIQAHTSEGNVLAYDLKTLRAAGATSQPKIRHGLVVEEILDEVESGNYDLVVIGRHRQEGWERLLLEDLAHEIITKADRPVLVLS